MSQQTLQIVVALGCVTFSFFASAWANAVVRLSMGRAIRLEVEQPGKGKLLVKIAENPRPYVAATLMMLLLARVTATVFVTSLLVSAQVPWPRVIAIAGLTFLLFQLVELAPRTWVFERPDQVLLLAARPVYYLGKALAPVTRFMVSINRVFLLILPGRGLPRGPLTSEEEIKGIIEVAEQEEVIETEEREMIHSIFEFGDTVVREVMVPRPDMICIEGSAAPQEALDLMLKSGTSRVPVIEDSIDNVLGLLYLRDVVKKLHNGAKRPRKARDLAREASFVPESKKVVDLLTEMRQTKTHMVLVVDEYGGVAGLVTLEDLLEEIVGEISDEYDREEPGFEEIDETTLRVDARVGIDELNERLNSDLPHTEWDSVGGLVGGMLGRVASEGDEVSVDGIRFEVEKTKGRRIAKVIVHHSSNR